MAASSPKLLDQVRFTLRQKHYSIRTEEAYLNWIKRYILFHHKRHPAQMGIPEIEAFLTHLAVDGNVAASTQNQAFSAVLFLYRHVLRLKLDDVVNAIRAKKPSRLPTVLTKAEVTTVIVHLRPEYRLAAQLLYGAGLRIMECLRLRVKDIDFEQKQLMVRNGKGNKDRVTILPDTLCLPLKKQLQLARRLHLNDLDRGYGQVYLPYALDRKYPNAGREWRWQYVFPAEKLSTDPRAGLIRRHHLSENSLQRAVYRAAQKAGLTKHVTCHTFRHSFATHLLADGYDIRTVQELLGHKSVETTMIYTHVLNRGGRAVRSPMDSLRLNDSLPSDHTLQENKAAYILNLVPALV